MSNLPSSVVDPIPNQRDPSPEVGPSNGPPPPKPLKVPLGEFRKKRPQIQMRMKVLETYVVEAISQNGNPYQQLVVSYLLLSTMEKKVKRTAAYTEEAEIILGADPQAGRIYIVTQKKSIEGWWIWESIQPAK